MKYQIYKLIALAITFTALCIAPHAQSLGKANVPFAFGADDQIITVGGYKMSRLNQQAILVSQIGTDIPVAMVPTTVNRMKCGGEVNKWIFRRYGQNYYLEAVCIHGSKIVVPISKTEKRQWRNSSRQRSALINFAPVIPEIVEVLVFEV